MDDEMMNQILEDKIIYQNNFNYLFNYKYHSI